MPGLFSDDCYQGILFWNKRHRYKFALSCTPGGERVRELQWTTSVEVELAAEAGLDEVGSLRSGITETRTLQVSDTFSLSCCRFQDEEGNPRQSCRERWFQPVFDHQLYYWDVDCSTGESEDTFYRAQGRWLDDALDSLLCCDKCCYAEGPQ